MRNTTAKEFWKVLLVCFGMVLAFVPGVQAFDYEVVDYREIERQRGYPVRGMPAKQVVVRFGDPVARTGPVGNPAISVWDYEKFKVYFERHLVITSVTKDDRLPTEIKKIQ